MRCVKAKKERSIDITCDVGARIAERCIIQPNVRVFYKLFRFLAVVLALSLSSRTLVYAYDDYYAVDRAMPSYSPDSNAKISVNEPFFYVNNKHVANYTGRSGFLSQGTAQSAAKGSFYNACVFTESQMASWFGIYPGDVFFFRLYNGSNSGLRIIDGTVASFTRNTDVWRPNVDYFTVSYRSSGSSDNVSASYKFGEDFRVPYSGGSVSFRVNTPVAGTYSAVVERYLVTPDDYKWRTLSFKAEVNATFNMTYLGKLQAEQDSLDSIDKNTDKIVDNQEQYHQEELDKGEQSGSDASNLVQDLTDQVKSKWEILFYPIEFTQRFLGLFTSSSGGSTVISFPAFSIMGMTVWDSYDFDLSTIKNQFSTLFDLLYMVIGVIEVMWFLKYLYRKYDEVFGGQ